jgi:hypothetical protein
MDDVISNRSSCNHPRGQEAVNGFQFLYEKLFVLRAMTPKRGLKVVIEGVLKI